MKKAKILNKKSERRARRTRARVKASGGRFRLSVFRSNMHIYAQIIDDAKGNTVVSFSSLAAGAKTKTPKIDQAKNVGRELAKEAKAAGIKEVVFDKGKYQYHGRVKALAEGAREGGLLF